MFVLSTDSLKGYGLNRIFEFAKKAGYDGIDLQIDPKDFDTQNADYLKSLSETYALPIISLQTPLQGSSQKVEKAVEMARKINCSIIIIQAPAIFDFRYASWLKREIPKIRQKENISIALENAPSGSYLGIISSYAMDNLNALREFKHVCLDTSRVAAKNQDIIRIYHALEKFIVHVHLSNVKGSDNYCLPEKGIIPLESLLSKMKTENYAGAFSLKVTPKAIQVGSDEKVLANLKSAKEFYEKYFQTQS
jgi:sugar phosphate isomerase/epimerase